MKTKSPSRNFLIPIKKPYKFGYGRKKSYLCTDLGYKSCIRFMVRRDGRVVDYSSLENCRTERYRGFESLSLRIAQRVKSLSYNNLGTFYLSILKSCPTFCPKVAPLFSPKIYLRLKNTFSCKDFSEFVIICFSANNRSRKK